LNEKDQTAMELVSSFNVVLPGFLSTPLCFAQGELLILHIHMPETKKTNSAMELVSSFNVVLPGFEPGTHGFSVHCSTN
jgi:hypothetical protein